MPSENEILQSEINRLHRIISANQRLFITGAMLGNFIHDLNNPLTSINGNTELLQINPVVADPKIKKRVDTIQNGTKRLTDKLRQMQLFTKTGRGDMLVDVNEVSQEVARVSEYLPKQSKLPIVLNLSNNPLTFTGNSYQLAQALLLIIDNALDSVATSANPKVTLSTDQNINGLILISITNNGPMIEEEVAKLMFEPFFSTKVDALGMGLTAAKEMILANSGQITYSTSLEQTEFIITLPNT